MAIYDYVCEKCDKDFEITKPMKDSDRVEHCDQCKNVLQRTFSSHVQFIGTAVQNAEYYPSLGKVIKNNYHRSEEMKKNNLIEVGNERPERVRYHTEKHRLEKLKKDYED